MITTKRAVVLGGAGFLGRRLVALMAGDEGFHPAWPRFDEIHVFDTAPFVESRTITAAKQRTGCAITSERGDIRSEEAVRAAVRGAHTVFHLASVVDVGLRRNPIIDAVNVDGTRNVVRACEDLGVPRLVYTSSEDVVLSDVPIVFGDESIPYPTRLVHDYVRTKIEAERIVREADGRGNLRTCVIRPVHIYGPEDPHAIRKSLEAIAKRTMPFLLGDGRARFDVVYVDNVAHAHLLAAARLAAPDTVDVVGGQVYFVGEDNAPNYFEWLRPYAEARNIAMPEVRLPRSGVAVLVRLLEAAHRVTGIEAPIHRFHLYVLCQDFFFSSRKAARELGYRPLVSPDEAQRRTLSWVRALDLDV